MSSIFVCLMGIGIVFVGLVCIIFVCKIMGFLVTRFVKTDNKIVEQKSTPAPAASEDLPVDEKLSVIAGICAVIAEELGTDANNIRVLSFKAM